MIRNRLTKRLLAAAPLIALLAAAGGYAGYNYSAAADPDVAPIAPLSSTSGYTFTLDGKLISFPSSSPAMSGGSMMVPLRDLAEAFGAQVNWDEAAKTATVKLRSETVSFRLNEPTGVRNGTSYPLDTPAIREKDSVMVPLRFLSESLGYVVKWDGIGNRIAIANEANALETVGSEEKLLKLLSSVSAETTSGGAPQAAPASDMAISAGAATTVREMSSSVTNQSAAAKTKESSHSTTNVQVEGVDEGDIVKTDGRYLYQVNNNRIVISSALPAADMKVVASLPLEDGLSALELYVEDGRMIVIGHSYGPFTVRPMAATSAGAAASKQIAADTLPSANRAQVRAFVYDVTKPETPVKLREVSLDGNYISSRKIGNSFYLIANQYPRYYGVKAEGKDRKREPIVPAYRDTAVSDDWSPIGYDRIKLFPDSAPSSYLLVAGFRLDTKEEASIHAYLGTGQEVYASASNLYVTMTKRDLSSVSSKKAAPTPRNTQIVKFLLDQGKVRYAAIGEVSGSVLNQFSMDESDGYFRIATTKDSGFDKGTPLTENQIHVLSENMQEVGSLEKLAPGERIYSVRFMGSRAYVVTFRNVDPLFVLDLGDPRSPKVLGSLKIPGYSDYLHPYDDTHLIGFGKETVELPAPGKEAGGSESIAYYQGMKLALFDVSDVSHPIELFKETIGDRGTDSELLRNHKALLFSRESGLLAFPVSVAEVQKNEPAGKNGFPSYGEITFQGAYVYKLDLAEGFHLRGKLTHFTKEDMALQGRMGGTRDYQIQRLLTIGEGLYSLSPSRIQVNDLNSLQQTGSVNVP